VAPRLRYREHVFPRPVPPYFTKFPCCLSQIPSPYLGAFFFSVGGHSPEIDPDLSLSSFAFMEVFSATLLSFYSFLVYPSLYEVSRSFLLCLSPKDPPIFLDADSGPPHYPSVEDVAALGDARRSFSSSLSARGLFFRFQSFPTLLTSNAIIPLPLRLGLPA